MKKLIKWIDVTNVTARMTATPLPPAASSHLRLSHPGLVPKGKSHWRLHPILPVLLLIAERGMACHALVVDATRVSAVEHGPVRDRFAAQVALEALQVEEVTRYEQPNAMQKRAGTTTQAWRMRGRGHTCC